ncbi:CMP-N-acetylneuraminate-beta-1,4-galactoside alpha-2,3-sialyltransferase-like [Ptychodera flava]|uniref:CMP-N-acetylneuraminate-beta-1,4-galactoside alpha-2,3-sialyltransferase-like n=1 Tax=Ptychodera flava TaxID=63121 RepID=UPI003969F56C
MARLTCRYLLKCVKLFVLFGLVNGLFIMGYKVYFEVKYRTVQYPCDLKTHNREIVKKSMLQAGNASRSHNVQEQCKPFQSRIKMSKLRKTFKSQMPLFVNENYTLWSNVAEYPLPFGVQSYESEIDDLLKVVKETAYPKELLRPGCKKCVVVGSGGILAGSGMGLEIDSYDVVMRVNGGPTRCFEKDVGTKTTMRISYPEGAPQEPGEYDPSELFVLVPFKSKDLEWLERVATGRTVSWIGYWRPRIANSVPIPRSHFRILNPEIVGHTAFDLVKFPLNKGRKYKNVPTMGTICIMAAMTVCDEVAVAGFGYNPNDPDSRVHYYEDMKMDTAFVLSTHDIHGEKQFLKDMVKYGIIKDLTGGIMW